MDRPKWSAIVTYGAIPQTKVSTGKSKKGTLIAFLDRLSPEPELEADKKMDYDNATSGALRYFKRVLSPSPFSLAPFPLKLRNPLQRADSY